MQLVDPRLYHLDLTFCPLDERRALCAPTGWDSYGRKVIEALVPEPLWLEEDEALSFCANSVVVGTTIVMPSTPPRVGRQLEQWGFTVVESPVDEFLKAGGGCRCLTLALDTVLTDDRRCGMAYRDLEQGGLAMATIVHDLELPELDTMGLDRDAARAALEAARDAALVGEDPGRLHRDAPRRRDGDPRRPTVPLRARRSSRRCRASRTRS